MAAPKRIWIILAFAAVYLIWGSTYLGILFAIQSMPPFLMAGMRFFLAGLMVYWFVRWRGAPRPSFATWRTAFIVGGCLLLGGNGGVTLSEKWVPTGLAALLVATVPIYIALLTRMTGSSSSSSATIWIGLIGGFVGVGILVGPAFSDFSDPHHPHLALGMSVLLIGSFIWSVGSLYSRHGTNAPSPFVATGQQMLCGGGLLMLAGIITGELRGFDPRHITSLSLGGFAYLVFIGALVGYPAYIYLLRHCSPAKVATYAYVNPIVAMILGALFAHERLTLRTLIAAGLIIGSVAIVIAAQQRKPKVVETIAGAIDPVDCT